MSRKYISFIPETITGQAILDSFVRTRRVIRYRENDKIFDRVKRGLPLYEVEKIESVGNNPNNLIIRGECLSACAYLKDKGVKVDLVYIDPPFASGADYAKKVFIRRNPKLTEKIAIAEEQLDIEELRSFEEKMYGDIWNKEDYLNWMYENLFAIKSIMTHNAIIWLHLDHSIGFYAKILLDEIFGEQNWLNTITWRCQVARGKKVDAFYYPYSSQYIMIYTKNKDVELNVWNIEKKEIRITKEEAESDFYKDEKGYFRTSDPGSYGFEKLFEFYKAGRIYVSKGGAIVIDEKNKTIKTTKGTIGIKYYLRLDGEEYIADRAIDNIWDDIPGLGTVPSEDVGYSTQKTESLLTRVIKASSNSGMIVADFFGGSGVCAKVANDLGRKFIHVDVGVNSIQTARDRLKNSGAEFDIYDVKDGISLFRNPVQTMDKLKSLITGLRNEDGLDSFWEGAINDSKLGLIPVYIPNLLDHSTKVLDIPLVNRILNEAIPDLPDNTKQVIVYYIDIDDEKELLNFIDEYNNTEVKIVLRDLKEILDEVVVNDIVEYEIRDNEIELTKFISDRLMQKIDEYNQKKGLNNKKKKQLSFEDVEAADEDEKEVTDSDENDINDDDEPETQKSTKKFNPIEISDTGLELIEMISLDCTNSEGIWKSDYEIKIDKNGFLIDNGRKTKQFWNGKISFSQKPLRIKIRNIAGDETIMNLL